MRSPLDKAHRITSPYGKRTLGGRTDFHSGIDMAPLDNRHPTTIHSVDTGKVCGVCSSLPDTHTGLSVTVNAAGNYVKIKNSDGFVFCYYHLKAGSVKLRLNQSVKTGDIIGVMGNTGRSTGTHLHYQINKPDSGTLDPLIYLNNNKSPALPEKYTPAFKKGDMVTIKPAAKNYATGQKIPDRVKGLNYTVMQTRASDRAVLLEEIMSWVHEIDVTMV